MKVYYGKEKVEKGLYLNLKNGELTQLYGSVRILPGNPEVRYAKVPGALAVVGGPLAGLAFIIFLPMVGIIGLGAFFAYKIRDGAVALVRKASRPASAEEAVEIPYPAYGAVGQETAKDIQRFIEDDEPDEPEKK